jgi:hypothetical protein
MEPGIYFQNSFEFGLSLVLIDKCQALTAGVCSDRRPSSTDATHSEGRLITGLSTAVLITRRIIRGIRI